MADKPNLFQKLFRKTKENLEKKPPEAAPPGRPPRPPTPPAAPPQKKFKIPLTPGKIEVYRTCPKKFHFSYIEKAPQGTAPAPNLSFDQSLHTALKVFFKSRGANEPLKLEKLMQLLGTSWDSRGYESAEQEQQFRHDAEAALRLFHQNFCQTPPRAVEIDYFFKIDLFGGEFSGRMDRVDQHPDGSIEIIDYKSGKTPAGGAAELTQSLPIQLLFLAGDVIWPGKVQKVTHLFLREGVALTVQRSPALLAQGKKTYLEIGEAIYQGKFQPVRSSACPFCDFRESCPVGQVPALTSTKVRTFLECPQKFAHYYLHRTAGRAEPAEPSTDLALDRALHDALTALHRDFKPAAHGDPQGYLFARFYEAVPKTFPEETVVLMKETGRELLQLYFKLLYPKSHTRFINEFLSLSTERYDFQITIDRIDEHPDGSLELIDYKTGKSVKDEGELKIDPVSAITCAVAAAKWPGRVKRFTHLYLRAARAVTVEVDEFMTKHGIDLLEDISERMRRKEFETLGGPGCSTCRAATQCQFQALTATTAKIQTLRECPRKYKFRYLERAPVPDKERPALLLNQVVRDVLRDFFALNQSADLEKLYKYYLTRIPTDVSLSLQARQFLEETGKKALKNFLESLEGKRPRVRTLADQARAPFEGVVLSAGFDRVDILPNGNYEVFVYKTTKRPMTVHEAEIDLSGVLTHTVASLTWPGKVERTTFLYLLPGERVVFTPSPRDLERLKLAVSEFQDENARGEFEGNRNPLCPYCDYLDRCEDAKRMLLSPSKINSFLSCPLKYKMNYIDRVPKEPRPTPHLNFDRSLHYALREYHEHFERKMQKVNPFRELLAKHWIDGGYTDWEEEQRFKSRGMQMLEEYFNGLTGEENPVMFETSARWTFDDLDLAVQIDRVDQLPDGKYEIIDYKSGKKIPDERIIHEDMGLLNMYLAASQRWPGQVAKVSYIFLAANKKMSLTPESEHIEAHKKRLRKIVAGITEAKWEPNKGALCAWCEFYNPCPEWKVKPFQMAGETPEVFRKRIRLSYSKMSLYLNCPRAYKRLYLDRVPPKPQPFFSFGTTIHETFEHIYDPGNPRPKPSLEEVLKIYDEVRLTHREGMASEEIEERYRQDGIRQITLYYNRFIKDQPFAPAHSIEDYFELPCGKYAVMTGFIDRIDKLPDGTYEILDYKTEPTMRTQDEVDHDKQLSIYYWACEDALGLKISKLSLFMLDHDAKITTTRTREDVPKVVEQVDKTAYAMINEKEFAPRKNKYCKSCDHLHDCPLKEEVLQDQSLISMKKF
ncbi:MAG: PD-(D/E)XK nuclease family protein [Candidatus Riflebacteria bacterium]|nr:PD-(D/E)XK nuclease family protein [Candidatus Riflebacteria bacterium]